MGRYLQERIQRYACYFHKAARYRSFGVQVIDLISHKLRLDIHPHDYYELEFYKNRATFEQKSRIVASRGSTYWPFQNNLLRYNILFTDKYVAKTMLVGLGLPTPKLISTIGNCYEIRTEEDLYRFLDKIDRDIVIKPISGMGGHNVLVLRREGRDLYVADRLCTRSDIWNHVKKDYQRGWIIEERVKNAGYYASVYPHSLNSFRVCTIRADDKRWHMARCLFKVGRGGRTVDNIQSTGIAVYPDESGRTFAAHDFLYDKPITHHPDTGVALTGIDLKGYREVTALGLEASRKLGFMGTIGWDIAYTETGPSVLEGNLWWGCRAHQLYGGPLITDELARGLKRHSMLSKWDKASMYPGFDRKRFWLLRNR